MLAGTHGIGRSPILTSSHRAALPPPSRLEATVENLASRGDVRTLVGVVELWSQVGEPTPSARLAQARAFFDLRLLDRAWIRLQELVESGEGGAAAYELAVRLCLARGWTLQARKVVDKGLELRPGDEAIEKLYDLLIDPPTLPEAVDVEGDDVPIETLLAQAERQMADSAFVRAQKLLERVRRREPGNRRAADLLWALDGQIVPEGVTLGELADRYGPDLSQLADLSDDPEHTESARLEDLPLQVERDDVRFPLLFRNLEPQTEAWLPQDREVTAVTSMADLDVPAETEEVATDPAELTSSGDETQIMRVVHKHGAAETERADKSELRHVGRSSPDSLARFDLAAFRREMGVDLPPARGDYALSSEDEDESLIVHTRRDEETGENDGTTDVNGLSLDTEAERRAAREKGTGEGDWVRPSTVATRPMAERREESLEGQRPRPRKRGSSASGSSTVVAWPWWAAALLALFGLGLVSFGVVALLATVR